MAACCLVVHQAGLPLLRLEAGEQGRNATLIDPCADLLFVSSQAGALGTLRRHGVAPERLLCVPDQLEDDALARLWPEVPEPAGACLRNGLPMYFGPTWSAHGVDGEPFVLIAVTLAGVSADRVRHLVSTLLALEGSTRQLWLIDAPTRTALQALLQAAPEFDGPLFLMPASGAARPSSLRDRIEAARLLCCEIGSLPEQIGLLGGASAALVDRGQVLADVATRMELALTELDLMRGTLFESSSDGLVSERPLDPQVLSALLGLDGTGLLRPRPVSPVRASGASAEIAGRLQAWIDRALAEREGPLTPAG